MKKTINIFLIAVILTTSFIPLYVKAGNSYAIKSPGAKDCTIKTAPNEGGSYLVPGSVHYLDTGDMITLVDGVNPVTSTVSRCKTAYYNVYFGGLKGYVCGDYIQFNTTGKYDEEFRQAGLPESYWSSLNLLKEKHPNWTFKAQKLGVDWNNATIAESQVGVSLISTSNQGWLSTAGGAYNYYNDTFNTFDGGWYAAGKEIVAYYMDPRNFLNEKDIFMFENLAYAESQNKNGTQAILNGTFMSGNYGDTDGATRNYADTFVEAGRLKGVSPYLLAARSKQEITKSSAPYYSNSVSGTVSGYENLFNYFNIGAYASGGRDAIENGLIWARNKGWNTRYKSILGGAEVLGKNYINAGQNTLYLQKWDMIGNLYTNQYMTNIVAAKSEAGSIYDSYVNLGIINSDLTFFLPVYDNMPSTVSMMPSTGNPNFWLKDLKINGQTITNFNTDQTNYTYYTGDNSVDIGATAINSQANINGTGKINLTAAEQTLNITVTAGNGNKRVYQVKVIKSGEIPISVNEIVNKIGIKNDGTYFRGLKDVNVDEIYKRVQPINGHATVEVRDSNGTIVNNRLFKTGDTVKITSGNDQKEYKVVINGDINGDGLTDIVDLLLVQKIILNSTTMSEVYLKAADINKDSKIDIVDLLLVQKNILGQYNIEQ